MLILSFNVRGSGGASKMLALKDLIVLVKPDVVLLQETMVDHVHEKDYFLKICPTWSCATIDSVGNSGGLLSGWNPCIGQLETFQSALGIFLEGRVSSLPDSVTLLNCDGPYKERLSFWQLAENTGVLEEESLIVGGDLNLTLSTREVWGVISRLDPLADYFFGLFDAVGLVDVIPKQLGPTWRNGRVGGDGVSKRLDRFLINNHFNEGKFRSKSWTINSLISDHNSICLQLESSNFVSKYPFKFNHAWLKEDDFVELVRSFWLNYESYNDMSAT